MILFVNQTTFNISLCYSDFSMSGGAQKGF
jgi:hypothetical protein